MLIRENSQRHPFGLIPEWLKILVAIYFVYNSLILNFLQLATEPNISISLIVLVFLRVISGFLVVLPIFFFRTIGIIHLLAFPFFLSILKQLVQDPLLFIAPLEGTGVILESTIAYSLSYESLLSLNLEQELYAVIGKSFLLLGFVSVRRSRLSFKEYLKSPASWKFLVLSLFFIAVTLAFFQSQGGITNWIIQWGAQGGRRNAMEGLGPLLKLLKVSYIVPLTWYVFRGNQVFKHPIFLIMVSIALFSGFFSTGSRSSLLHGIIPFFLVYMVRYNKIPLGTIAAFGLAFVILFGFLGQVRTASTYTGGDFSWEEIDYTIDQNLEYALDEADKWGALGADVATYQYISETEYFLLGKSYVAFLAFWIPRAIWPDKPHGVGYYTGRDIFHVQAGIPPSEVAEAFWNFGLAGVILISFIHGALIRLISDTFMSNPEHGAILVLYVIILATGFSLGSTGLTRLTQTLLYAVITLKFLKVL